MVRIVLQNNEELKEDTKLCLGAFSEDKEMRVRLVEEDGELIIILGNEDDLYSMCLDFGGVKPE